MAKNNCSCGYAGKIPHSATKVVEAPFKSNGSRGKAKVHNGTDLRTGK